MEIRIGSLSRDAREATGAALVIDVFRAFTTAAIAFDRGRGTDHPGGRGGGGAGDPEKQPGHADILMGEVAGRRPRGLTTATRRLKRLRSISAGKSVFNPPAPVRWAPRRRERPAAIRFT